MTPEQSHVVRSWLDSHDVMACTCGGEDWDPQAITGDDAFGGAGTWSKGIWVARHDEASAERVRLDLIRRGGVRP